MTTFLASLDASVLETLYAHRALATTKIFISISELGGAFFIFGLAVCVGLYLLLRCRYVYLAGLVVSVVGSAGAVLAIKSLVHRARPDLVFQAYTETGFSFPSAHATLASVLYGFCIYLAWRTIPAGPWRIAATILLAVLIAAIAFSRMYLGVHYMTDVLAGLVLGGLFAWIGSVVVKKLEQRD
ncbi:MAG: phosphatase PAP2 family protein [bacterium]|nr:phosphatase PAP2 family protein [bacterium]